ncbi:MAG: Ig-like domain-containing protein [Microgenomates group bacterium]
MRSSIYIIIFLILALIGSLTLVLRSTIFVGKATGSASVASGNSYLFASPLQAKADGREMIRITAFLLDGRGVGVANQTVDLHTSPSVTIKTIQAITDDSGKAVFDISSSQISQVTISASHNGQTLPQTVKVTFY